VQMLCPYSFDQFLSVRQLLLVREYEKTHCQKCKREQD
jgi:hypothetical protein